MTSIEALDVAVSHKSFYEIIYEYFNFNLKLISKNINKSFVKLYILCI